MAAETSNGRKFGITEGSQIKHRRQLREDRHSGKLVFSVGN